MFSRTPASSVPLIALAMIVLIVAGCNLKSNRLNREGVQSFQSGQITEAVNHFQKAMMQNPRNADSFYNLAASYFALGRQNRNKQWLDQAEQLYRQAISLDDLHVDAHRGLAALLVETEREDFAFDLLQTWQARHPESTSPLIELARLHREYGDNRHAADLLSDAIRLDSNDTRALQSLAHIRETQGQLQLALENYSRLLEIDPGQTDIVTRIGSLQSRLAQAGGAAQTAPERYGANPANIPRY